MAMFDVGDEVHSEENEINSKTVSPILHQNGRTIRVSIPAEHADEIGIEPGKPLLCTLTEDKNGVILEKINNA